MLKVESFEGFLILSFKNGLFYVADKDPKVVYFSVTLCIYIRYKLMFAVC